MENKYHENDSINAWVLKAVALVNKSSTEREKLTDSELQNLRHEIATVRTFLATDVLVPISNDRASKELEMEGIESEQFAKMLFKFTGSPIENPDYDPKDDKSKRYKLDSKGKPRLHTASTAESLARKAYKHKKRPYAIAKEKYNKAKNFESMVYQLMKSLDGVANALSGVVKI